MKTISRLFIIAFFVTATLTLNAQAPPHPNNGSAPTPTGNTPVGAGAALADGPYILLVLGLAYAIRKRYASNGKEVENQV